MLIIKIGTESLRGFETSEKVNRMIREISALMARGEQIILITSGAVGFGRGVAPHLTDKSALAAIGQPLLMESYRRKFSEHGIVTSQLLPTHADIEDRVESRDQLISTILSLWSAGILPIMNENDPLSTAEMKALGRWADNDRNAFLMANIIGKTITNDELRITNTKWVEILPTIILITGANGVYRDRHTPDSRIEQIHGVNITEDFISEICGAISSGGTGGMGSKLEIGRDWSTLGGVTHICDGVTSGILDFVDGTSRGGTTIR